MQNRGDMIETGDKITQIMKRTLIIFQDYLPFISDIEHYSIKNI